MQKSSVMDHCKNMLKVTLSYLNFLTKLQTDDCQEITKNIKTRKEFTDTAYLTAEGKSADKVND